MSITLKDQAAIVGIGQTEFSKNSGRSELQLACEAVSAAIDDAGLEPDDVDGMTTFSMDMTDDIEIARAVGIGGLRFQSQIPHGGGAALGVVTTDWFSVLLFYHFKLNHDLKEQNRQSSQEKELRP